MEALSVRGLVVVAIVAVAGCSSTDAPAQDAAGAAIESVDLVVSASNTVGYLGFVDDNGPRFPQPGECAATSTDAAISSTSCFTGLYVAGTPLSTYGSLALNPYVGGAIASDTTVSVSSCGHEAEAPVHVGSYPMVDTYDAKFVGTDLVVTWSAASAASVLVSVNGGFGAYTCHVAGTSGQHRFAGYDSSGYVSVAIQPLRAPEITATDLGPIRVWYGDIVYPDIAAP